MKAPRTVDIAQWSEKARTNQTTLNNANRIIPQILACVSAKYSFPLFDISDPIFRKSRSYSRNHGLPDVAVTDYRNTLLVRILNEGLEVSEGPITAGRKSTKTESVSQHPHEIIVDKREPDETGCKLSTRLFIFGAALQRFVDAGFKLPDNVIKSDFSTSDHTLRPRPTPKTPRSEVPTSKRPRRK